MNTIPIVLIIGPELDHGAVPELPVAYMGPAGGLYT